MLGAHNAIATAAVKDLAAARRFYSDVLGLELLDARGEEVLIYAAGNGKLNVYRSSFAGTSKATIVTWAVGDQVDDTVRTLKANGVQFEHYDLPGLQLEGDVHVGRGGRVAWFKDPDGNIHSIVNA